MPRGQYKKKEIIPDPVFEDIMVSKFINCLMRRGKKSVARRVVYNALDIIKEKTKKEPLEVFASALENTSPSVEVKSRRMGGAVYQVPIEIKGERRTSLAMRWIVAAAKNKKGKAMAEKLAEELMAASKNEGAAVKKKIDTHRMAEANRAFAHFA
jgi:small subunit ribosomal protein S7